MKHHVTTKGLKKRFPTVLDKENIPPSEHMDDKKRTPTTHRAKRNKTVVSHCISATKINKTIPNINKKLSQQAQVVSPRITSTIDLISRRLKENMTKVTYNMMACLVLSNQPQDRFLYETIVKTLNKSTENEYSMKEAPVIHSLTKEIKNDIHCVSAVTDIFSSANHSFDVEQENEFISSWLQYDTSSNSSEYSHDALDDYSIATEQELSDLLSQDIIKTVV